MSRLLFAAARGARIEVLYTDRQVWIPAYAVRILAADPNEWQYRIHADDVHLQYGPISTVLRDYAHHSDGRRMYWPSRVVLAVIRDYLSFNEDVIWTDALSTASHDFLFLLILAEALADEGL